MIRKLQAKTNKDGNIIYDGTTDENDRTGSNLKLLVQYAMGKQREKPLDYEVFVFHVMQNLKIPKQHLYCAKTIWKKLEQISIICVDLQYAVLFIANICS